MTDHHPHELDLLDVALGDATDDVLEHVASCPRCSAAVSQLGSDVELDGSRRASEVLANTTRPRALHVREPRAGDLWRATWDTCAQLVLILSVDGANDTVDVVAVGELDTADDHSIPIDKTILGWSAAGLFAVRATIPIRTMDLLLGENIDRDPQNLAAPIVHTTDLRELEHATFHENLAHLADAAWAAADATGAITDQLRSRWATPSQLASALGIGNTDARELMQGRRAPSAAEESALKSYGLNVTGVAAPHPNAIWAVDRPRFRQRWKELAAARSLPEAEYRWAAYIDQQFAVAARQTGVDTNSRETWLGRVSEVLRELA